MDTYLKFEPLWFTPPDGSGHGLWKDSPSPPAPQPVPDPAAQIQAQAKAIPSAYTPQGSRVYSGDPNVVGSFQYADTYAPSQQRQFDQKNQIAEQLIGRAGSQLPQIPSAPFMFNGATDPTSNQAYQAQEAMINRTFDRDRNSLEQTLANKGIPMGAEAYNQEIGNFDLNKGKVLQQAAASANQQGYAQSLSNRQQNYNEMAALLGGQQLAPVSGGVGAGAIDTSGAFAAQQAGLNRNQQGALGAYNADVASTNSANSSAASLAAAGLGAWGTAAGAGAVAFF